MGFHFKLESVRSYKTFVEKQLKLQLGEAYCRQEEEEKCLQHYRSIRNDTPVIQGAVDVAQLLQGVAYIETLDKRIASQQEKVARAVKEVREKRNQVQLAMQERKVLDRLRQRQLVFYQYNQASKEQKMLDEAARNSYNRRRNN